MAKKKDLTETLAEAIVKLNKLRIRKKGGKPPAKPQGKTYTRKNIKAPKPGNKPKLKKTKTYSRPKPKPQAPSKPTPKVPKSQTAKTKLGKIRDKVKSKAKQAKKVIKKGAEKAKQYVKTKHTLYRVRPETPSTKTTRAMKGTKAIQKGLKIGKGVSKLAKIGKGLRTLGIGYAADLAAGDLTDRAMKQLDHRTRGKKMTLAEFRRQGKQIRKGERKSYGYKNLVQTPSPKWGVKKPKPETKKPTANNNKTSDTSKISWTNMKKGGVLDKKNKNSIKPEKIKVNKKNKNQERRKKAIRRAYGNINDKRMKQLLSRAVTQRELEES
tara:strand:+ start:43 stop:1017 length:975 start_codon:yes stop_codon:yes gene_type:complete